MLVEVSIFVQAGLGVALVNVEKIDPPQFHLFYGFVAIIAVGILYSYRTTSPSKYSSERTTREWSGLQATGTAP